MEVDALTILLTITIAVVLGYIRFSKSEPDVHPLLLQQQASVTPIRSQGESAIHRSKSVPHGSPLSTRPSEKVKTLHDVWQVGSAINPTGRALLYMIQNQFGYTEVRTQIDRRWGEKKDETLCLDSLH